MTFDPNDPNYASMVGKNFWTPAGGLRSYAEPNKRIPMPGETPGDFRSPAERIADATAAAARQQTAPLGKGNSRAEPEIRAQTESEYKEALRKQIERIPPHDKLLVAVCKAALDEPDVHPQAKVAILGLLEHISNNTLSTRPEVWAAIPPLPAAELEAMKKEDAHWLVRTFKWCLAEQERWSREHIFWDDPR